MLSPDSHFEVGGIKRRRAKTGAQAKLLSLAPVASCCWQSAQRYAARRLGREGEGWPHEPSPDCRRAGLEGRFMHAIKEILDRLEGRARSGL